MMMKNDELMMMNEDDKWSWRMMMIDEGWSMMMKKMEMMMMNEGENDDEWLW